VTPQGSFRKVYTLTTALTSRLIERPASVNIPTVPTVPVLIPAVPRSFYGTEAQNREKFWINIQEVTDWKLEQKILKYHSKDDSMGVFVTFGDVRMSVVCVSFVSWFHRPICS